MFGSKVVMCKLFLDRSEKKVNYSFFCDDIEVKKDSTVVVDTTRGFQLGKVTKIEGLTPQQRAKAAHWVVQTIDAEKHKKRLEQATIIQEIDNQMQELMDHHNKYALYVELAKTDPAMKKLIDRLKSVNPDIVPQIEG